MADTAVKANDLRKEEERRTALLRSIQDGTPYDEALAAIKAERIERERRANKAVGEAERVAAAAQAIETVLELLGHMVDRRAKLNRRNAAARLRRAEKKAAQQQTSTQVDIAA